MSNKKSISERYVEALNSGLLSDVEFHFPATSDDLNNCNVKILPAHKYILALASPVFAKMFFSGFQESKINEKTIVKIEDIHHETFLLFLTCVYSRQFEIKELKTAISLYYVANKYEEYELEEHVDQFIHQNLCIENAIQVYEFANFYNIISLKDTAMKIIKVNAEEILPSEQMNNIKMETLLNILNQKGLNIRNELPLFQVLDDFANGNRSLIDGTTDQRAIFVQEAHKIHYLTMSSEEFNEGPMKSHLLTNDEKLCITNVLTCGDKSFYKYPFEFSKASIPRKHYGIIERLRGKLASKEVINIQTFSSDNNLKRRMIPIGTYICGWTYNYDTQDPIKTILLNYLIKRILVVKPVETYDDFLLRIIDTNDPELLDLLIKFIMKTNIQSQF